MGDNLDDDENYYNAPDPKDQKVRQPLQEEEDNYYGATAGGPISGSGGAVKPPNSNQQDPSEEDNYYGASDSSPTKGGGTKLSSIKANLFGSKPAPQTDTGKGSGQAPTSGASGGHPTEEEDENFYNMPNMDDEVTNTAVFYVKRKGLFQTTLLPHVPGNAL